VRRRRKSRISTLEDEVRDLKKRVEFLMKINGADLNELRRAEDGTLMGHYRDAVQLLGYTGTFGLDTMEKWSLIFAQLGEPEFRRIQRLVDFDWTWEPFLRLCLKMMTILRRSREFATSPPHQQTYALLDRGRRNMRDSAVIMIRSSRDLPPEVKGLLIDDEASDQFSRNRQARQSP
jgi:hypothetical protein